MAQTFASGRQINNELCQPGCNSCQKLLKCNKVLRLLLKLSREAEKNKHGKTEGQFFESDSAKLFDARMEAVLQETRFLEADMRLTKGRAWLKSKLYMAIFLISSVCILLPVVFLPYRMGC